MKSFLRGYVKQIKVSNLDNRTRKLIDECFPHFSGNQEIADSLSKGGFKIGMYSKGSHPVASGRMRRFAGGANLSGGRYYSLCGDSSGYDGGTLVWELMSYWNAGSKWFPELIDSTVHKDADTKLRKQIPWLDKPYLMLRAYEIIKSAKTEMWLGKAVAIVMPLEIAKVEIHNVVDLRLPGTQDWFCEFFGHLEADAGERGTGPDQKIVIIKDAPKSFKDMLPTLLTPSPGGTSFHDAVGAWLRNHDVNGLVFPSARRNVNVRSRADIVEKHDGWNFVLYHGSPSTDYDTLFGLQPHWLSEREVGIKIIWKDSDSRREWSVKGAEEGERRWYDLEREFARTGLHRSVVRDSRFEAREKK